MLTGFAGSLYAMTLSFALASVGFGLFRPGFTSGAAWRSAPSEQNAVAGMVTSVNGIAYLAAPPLGVALYGLGWSLPFLVVAVADARPRRSGSPLGQVYQPFRPGRGVSIPGEMKPMPARMLIASCFRLS